MSIQKTIDRYHPTIGNLATMPCSDDDYSRIVVIAEGEDPCHIGAVSQETESTTEKCGFLNIGEQGKTAGVVIRGLRDLHNPNLFRNVSGLCNFLMNIAPLLVWNQKGDKLGKAFAKFSYPPKFYRAPAERLWPSEAKERNVRGPSDSMRIPKRRKLTEDEAKDIQAQKSPGYFRDIGSFITFVYSRGVTGGVYPYSVNELGTLSNTMGHLSVKAPATSEIKNELDGAGLIMIEHTPQCDGMFGQEKPAGVDNQTVTSVGDRVKKAAKKAKAAKKTTNATA